MCTFIAANVLAHSRYFEQRIKELEEDLLKKSESIETLKDRLSDRELEITILQKRLNLRASSATAAAAAAATAANNTTNKNSKSVPEECEECKRKERVIDQLYLKLEALEEAVESFCSSNGLSPKTPKHQPPPTPSHFREKNVSSSSASGFNLDVILKNITELNNLITESRKDVEYLTGNAAQFQKHDVVSLTFYSDGFKIDNNRFRPYREPASQLFMKDLSDGFYPAEMQGDYPEGVSFLVSDKRFRLYGDGTCGNIERIAFSGKGRPLESRPGSSATPSVTTLSPSKKALFPPLNSSIHSPPPPDTSRPNSSGSSSKNNGSQANKKVNDISNISNINRNKGQLQPIKGSPTKNISSFSSNIDKQIPSNNKPTIKIPSKYIPFKRMNSTTNGVSSKGTQQTINKKKDVCQLKIHGIEESPFLLELVSYDTVKTLRGVLANVIKTNHISKFYNKRAPPVKSKDGKPDEKATEPMFQLYFGLPKQRLSDDSKTLGDLGLSPNAVLHMSRR